MKKDIPVYIFFGFMDSGKTTLVKETLFENGFANDLDSFLLIVCEDGEEEYDEDEWGEIQSEENADRDIRPEGSE